MPKASPWHQQGALLNRMAQAQLQQDWTHPPCVVEVGPELHGPEHQPSPAPDAFFRARAPKHVPERMPKRMSE